MSDEPVFFPIIDHAIVGMLSAEHVLPADRLLLEKDAPFKFAASGRHDGTVLFTVSRNLPLTQVLATFRAYGLSDRFCAVYQKAYFLGFHLVGFTSAQNPLLQCIHGADFGKIVGLAANAFSTPWVIRRIDGRGESSAGSGDHPGLADFVIATIARVYSEDVPLSANTGRLSEELRQAARALEQLAAAIENADARDKST